MMKVVEASKMAKMSFLFLISCFVLTLAAENLNENDEDFTTLKDFSEESEFTEQLVNILKTNSIEMEKLIREVSQVSEDVTESEGISKIESQKEIQPTKSEKNLIRISEEEGQTAEPEQEEDQTTGPEEEEEGQTTEPEEEEDQTTGPKEEEDQTIGPEEKEEDQTAEPEEEEDQTTGPKEEEEGQTIEPEEEEEDQTTGPKEEEDQTTGPKEEEDQTTGTEEVISTRKPNDPCNPNPCQNGGVCNTNQNDRFECECPKGTKGKRCERVDWCKVLRDDGTTGKSYCNRGEAKCVPQRNGNFSCKCYNRKKEFNYEIGKCKSRDMCSPDPCQHGGICSTSGNQAHCECPEGAYGRYCERVNWCFIKMDNGKSGADYCDQGEAKCVENRRMKNFTCVCYNKRKTFNEELHECIDESYKTEIEAAEALTECEQDTIGYDECRDKDAFCFNDPYSYLGYVCVCKDGTKLEGGACKTNENSVYNAYASELKCSDGNCGNDANNGDSSSMFLILIISMSANLLLVFGVIIVVSYKRIRKMKKDPLIPIEN